MKKISFCLVSAILFLLLPERASAQTSFQRVSFLLTADYQTNIYSTNNGLTNVNSRIKEVVIATGNIVRAIAIDLEGTNWPIWAGSAIIREVNLTNGNEGIFLRKNGVQTNVSSFFGASFSNNFTAELTNQFPTLVNNYATVSFATNGLSAVVSYDATNAVSNLTATIVTNGVTNTFTNGVTNIVTNNYTLENPLVQGYVIMTGPTNFTTNYSRTSGTYFLSLNTTNLKFNLVGAGDGRLTAVAGRIGGVLYNARVNSEIIGIAGTFYLNTTSNIFDMGDNPPVSFTGPLRGTVFVGVPNFTALPGP